MSGVLTALCLYIDWTNFIEVLKAGCFRGYTESSFSMFSPGIQEGIYFGDVIFLQVVALDSEIGQ